MRSGQIVADGPKEELLRAEVLSALFAIEVTVVQRDGFYHLW